MKKDWKVHVALILVSCLFGTNYVVSKYLLKFLPPSGWALARALCTSLILFILVRPIFKARPPTPRQWLEMGVLGFFGVIINQIAFFEGLVRTTSTHAAIINTTIPVFTLFFSVVMRQEKPSVPRALGMALGVTGILVMLEIEKQNFGSKTFWGDLLNVANSLSFSLYLVLSKKLAKGVHPLMVTLGMFAWGTLGIALYGGTGALRLDWLGLPAPVYAGMVFVVLGATVSTYYLNNWALARAESSLVAVYIYIQPVLAALLSRLIYHEQLTPRVVLASLLVFTGVALGGFTGRKKRSEVLYAE